MQGVSITKRDIRRKMRDGQTATLTRYVLHFKDPKTGARAQKFYERQKEALAAQREILLAFEQNTYMDRRDVPTVAEAFDHWLEDRRGQIKDRTLDGYYSYKPYIVGPLLLGTSNQRFEYSLTQRIPEGCSFKKMLGDIKVTELTTAEIRTWHKFLIDSVGAHTANKCRLFLQTMLALAAEDFGVRPPLMPKRLGRGKTKEKKAILMPEQVGKLIGQAKKDSIYGIYYAFPFLTGVRPSEQLGLLWEDVDLEKRVIHIRRMQERDGTITNMTKTIAGFRDIPMSNLLHQMLIEWRIRCPRKNGALYRVFPNPGTPAKWPLPRRNGGNVMLYSNFRTRIWARAMSSAGLPYVTPHSARHFFISTLQSQGVEIGLVAKLAGHANAIVTLGHYTQAVRGGENAMEILTKAFLTSPAFVNL